MILSLMLSLAVAQTGDVGLATAPRAARLVAESPPPLPDQLDPSGADVKAELAEVSKRIAAIDVNWPTGAVILSYAGGITAYTATLLAVMLGVLVRSSVTLIVTIAVAAAGLAVLLVGLVVGFNVATAARLEREELIEQRRRLQEQLGPAEGVPLVRAPVPTVELARF
jgi:hypothetical protein